MMTIMMHRRRTGSVTGQARVIGLAIVSSLALIGGTLLLVAS